MIVDQSIVLWHSAASLIHRKVALASFFHAVRRTPRPILFREIDPAAALILAIAGHLGMAARGITDDQLRTTPELVAGATWIGTHTGTDDERCAQLVALSRPPAILLCLGDFALEDQPPTGHRPFITGESVRIPSP